MTVEPAAPPTRVIVVGVIRNPGGDYLLCRMPPDRGVFPGEWGLPGGGVEPGETLEQALRREIREEVGLEIEQITPLFFTDATYPKTSADGTRREIYMIFLLFACTAVACEIRLNPEFDAVEWVPAEKLLNYRLNRATVGTFSRLGLLKE